MRSTENQGTMVPTRETRVVVQRNLFGDDYCEILNNVKLVRFQIFSRAETFPILSIISIIDDVYLQHL